MRILKITKIGRDVAAWQAFLNSQNISVGKTDGVFGGVTRQATILFQQKRKLDADGVVGHDTLLAAKKLGFAEPDGSEIATPGLDGRDEVIREIAGVPVFQTADGQAVYYKAGMTIDADGAYRAYKIPNKGLDVDKNGKDKSGRWVGAVIDSHGNPVKQKEGDPFPGYLISTTSLEDPSRSRFDPLRYVDAEKVPYIVLPGGHLGAATLGDYGMVVNTSTGKFVQVIVADSGPKSKLGEASIATALALFADPKAASPRIGGTEEKFLRYIVFPGSKDGRFPSSHPKDESILASSLAHIQMRAGLLFANLSHTHQTALLAKGMAGVA